MYCKENEKNDFANLEKFSGIVLPTADGSHTIYMPEIDEHYHSTHGAINESTFVFIEAGLKHCPKREITIFEIGFGTGLNALLTYQVAIEQHLKIKYITIEKFPLKREIWQTLNYSSNTKSVDFFEKIHEAKFNLETKIDANFTILKINNDLTNFNLQQLPMFDLIYFDAFSPNKQPEMWSEDILKSIYNQANREAILTTYCAKGIVRRAMQKAGFKTERLPGPVGKREMIRAIKP